MKNNAADAVRFFIEYYPSQASVEEKTNCTTKMVNIMKITIIGVSISNFAKKYCVFFWKRYELFVLIIRELLFSDLITYFSQPHSDLGVCWMLSWFHIIIFRPFSELNSIMLLDFSRVILSLPFSSYTYIYLYICRNSWIIHSKFYESVKRRSSVLR